MPNPIFDTRPSLSSRGYRTVKKVIQWDSVCENTEKDKTAFSSEDWELEKVW